ncbi:MAG: UDP-N-acetylmuramate--L-alanine ligase [Holosporales bacterium]|nr:UDP-N-acetylmuramate--L-alanine ligase [Holosporales bacterium]
MHFVGIGGIGMSGIAEILHNQGYPVKGSDLTENSSVRRLKAVGIPVTVGHDAANIVGAQVVVISSAIPQDNPEIVAARDACIPIITRGEMLAEVIRLKKAIAISGTHGKTTTTSIIAALLNTADFDPTIINGGIINKLQTNAKLGSGEWFVVEADESDGSFLRLPSVINVITNIEPEHMEHFQSIDALEKAFLQFIRNLPFYGLGVVCTDDPIVNKNFTKSVDRRIISYGLQGTPNFKAENIRTEANGLLFDVSIALRQSPVFGKVSKQGALVATKRMADVFLPMFGEHNVLNALAGIAVATELGINLEIVKKTLAEFTGVKRRFSILGAKGSVTFVDDYAHHPTEIKAVLNAARQTTAHRVIIVFQAHRYTRFSRFWGDFLNALSQADAVITMPVYSAGEEAIKNITGQNFAKDLGQKYEKESYFAQTPQEALDIVKKIAKEGDFVIGMGAGTISEFIRDIYEHYE